MLGLVLIVTGVALLIGVVFTVVGWKQNKLKNELKKTGFEVKEFAHPLIAGYKNIMAFEGKKNVNDYEISVFPDTTEKTSKTKIVLKLPQEMKYFLEVKPEARDTGIMRDKDAIKTNNYAFDNSFSLFSDLDEKAEYIFDYELNPVFTENIKQRFLGLTAKGNKVIIELDGFVDDGEYINKLASVMVALADKIKKAGFEGKEEKTDIIEI